MRLSLGVYMWPAKMVGKSLWLGCNRISPAEARKVGRLVAGRRAGVVSFKQGDSCTVMPDGSVTATVTLHGAARAVPVSDPMGIVRMVIGAAGARAIVADAKRKQNRKR